MDDGGDPQLPPIRKGATRIIKLEPAAAHTQAMARTGLPGIPGLVPRITRPHGDQVVTDFAQPRGVVAGLLRIQCRQRVRGTVMQGQIMQGHESGRHQFDLAEALFLQRPPRADPLALGNFTVVDANLSTGRRRRKKPGFKPPVAERRWRPVGKPVHGVRLQHQAGLLHGLPAGGGPRAVLQVVAVPAILRIDPAAGEHPHAAKGYFGVLAQHQGFHAFGSIAQQHHRGRGDQRLSRTRLGAGGQAPGKFLQFFITHVLVAFCR